MQKNLQTIKTAFAHSFIQAISTKSVVDCVQLSSYIEYQMYFSGEYTKPSYLRKKFDNWIVLRDVKKFLKKANKFISQKNSNKNSALTIANIAKIDTYDFEISKETLQIIDTLSITMNTRLIKDVNYTIGFKIDHALLFNGEIKINWNFVKYYESYSNDINETNTPYTKIESKEKLEKICANHIGKEYLDILNRYNAWYVHEGDLELDTYDLKVNLIVTGNLTIKEPLTKIREELIVLGNTKVNTLVLEDENDVLFLGGIEFKIGLFIFSTGPYQVINNPKGPLFFSCSESFEIYNTKAVQCVIDIQSDFFQGDINNLLLDEFIEEAKEVKFEQIIIAIKAGENIFKKSKIEE